MLKKEKETTKQMVKRCRKELGNWLDETYEVRCVIHGKFANTFNEFLNNPVGCNECINQGIEIWDRDFHQSLIWQAINKLIADNKLAIKEAEVTDEN
tara:strand:- start:367 stop:657 length:291 start_codon:yes stop_codon:yes gene_type:complete